MLDYIAKLCQMSRGAERPNGVVDFSGRLVIHSEVGIAHEVAVRRLATRRRGRTRDPDLRIVAAGNRCNGGPAKESVSSPARVVDLARAIVER